MYIKPISRILDQLEWIEIIKLLNQLSTNNHVMANLGNLS